MDVGHLAYRHVSPIVAAGQRVRAGQQIAGPATGRHVHRRSGSSTGEARLGRPGCTGAERSSRTDRKRRRPWCPVRLVTSPARPGGPREAGGARLEPQCRRQARTGWSSDGRGSPTRNLCPASSPATRRGRPSGHAVQAEVSNTATSTGRQATRKDELRGRRDAADPVPDPLRARHRRGRQHEGVRRTVNSPPKMRRCLPGFDHLPLPESSGTLGAVPNGIDVVTVRASTSPATATEDHNRHRIKTEFVV